VQLKRLGRTGLKVTEICMGTMTFGNQAPEEIAHAILDRALEAGVNFIDTADIYPVPGSIKTAGRTEEVVGRWLKGKRQRVVLATKCGNRVGPEPNDQGLSRQHILDAVDASLRRLQTDYIDLYQVHRPDPETPLEETMRALDDLVRWGKVRYIGCSNFEAWRLCKALWISDRLHLSRFESVQPPYSLLARGIEPELLPLCSEEGVGVITYSPLAGGLLTGKYRRDQPPPEGTRFALDVPTGPLYRDRYWHDRMFAAVERVKEVAQACGVTPVQLSIAWLLHQSAVTSIILGATRLEHLEEGLKALELKLDSATIEALDAVAAPEASPPQPTARERGALR
jgi:aryl-alcohol dehydrogenase-like predicted oxidoreductase